MIQRCFLLLITLERIYKNKLEESHLPSSSTMQMMNKVKDLHMMEAIIVPCVISWCVRAAAVWKHTPGGVDEEQQVLCVHVPAGTSAYIHPYFTQAPPTSVHSPAYAEQCCYTTHIHTLTLYLPSSHSSSDLNSQHRPRPLQAKKGMVAYLYQLRCHWF